MEGNGTIMATTNLTSLKANALTNVVTTIISTTNIVSSGVPKVSSISYSGDDTAIDTAGGTVTLNGSGFNAGASVLIDGTYASVVTVVSSTTITFTAPAKAAGTYVLYVINTDGGTAISIPGISYSGTPTWSTASGSLATLYETAAISNTVTSTGDAPITYSLYSGTLPPGSSLNTSTGLISGTSQATASSTTYNFTIRASDAQNQDTDRAFSITINPDVVTWNSPADGANTSLALNQSMSVVTLDASSAAGKSISYSANALPTGVSISGSSISGTPTVEGVTTSVITATAADTNRSATRTFYWTVSVAGDVYWKNASLLLSATTPTPTFINDASLNNAHLTVHSNSRPNNFSPYTPGYYSNYFDGTGDYLSLTGTTPIQFGSGDFTIECWLWTSSASAGTFYGDRNGANFTGMVISIISSKVTLLMSQGSSWNINTYSSPTGSSITLNAWNHIAVTRSGTTVYVFINGVQSYTSTFSGTLAQSSTVRIGAEAGDTAAYTGYISNFRMIKGTALYTSTFTPSTTPLTAIENTGLLTCQSNRFIDTSNNSSTVTVTGDSLISPAHPFVKNTNYDSYGSLYLDGASYLSVPSANNSFLDMGSSDFTMECWIYPRSVTGDQVLIDMWNFGTTKYLVRLSGTQVQAYVNTGTSYNIAGTVTDLLNRWHHIAFVRNGSLFTLYYDGQSIGTPVSSAGAISSGTTNLGIGGYGGNFFTGYISNVRITKTALYTSNFSVPTSPLSAVSNTQLLTCQYNGGANNSTIVDQSNFSNIVTRAGNAATGTFSPYSQAGWSNYFAGGTDYISLPTAAATAFGGFNANITTIEFWVNQTTSSTTNTNEVIGAWAAVAQNGRFYVEVGNGAASTGATSKVFFTWTTSTGTVDSITTTAVVPVFQWCHVAIVVDATGAAGSHTVDIYVDGARQSFTGRNFSSQTVTYDRLRIGGNSSSYMNGYISNLRIVRGTTNIVGYSGANITVPTTPPSPSLLGTILSTCNSNRFIDLSPINSTLTLAGGTPKVILFSPFSGVTSVPKSYSVQFDGTGDYLQITEPAATSSDVTVECWIYPTAAMTGRGFVFSAGTNTSGSWALSISTTNTVEIWIDGYSSPKFSSALTVSDNTWNHVALVKSGGVVRVYVNGTLDVGSHTQAGNFGFATAQTITLGAYNALLNQLFFGYISNFRYVQGSALYSGSTITVPTNELTAISGTKVLTCQSSRIIDNSSNYYTITAAGDTKPRPFNPFGVTNTTNVPYSPSAVGGSVYYDGTGDYISATNPLFAFGASQDFTAEAWVYFTAVQASQSPGIIGVVNSASSTGWQIYADSNNGWGVRSNAANVFTVANPPKPNQWYHVAYVRKSGVHYLYVNGVLNTTTSSTSYTWSDNVFYSGYVPVGQNVYGYVSDARLTPYALYSSNFWPSQTPLTPITDVNGTKQASAILISGTSGGVIDAHASNNLETTGDLRLIPESPYEGSYYSNYFDGSGDYLTAPNSSNFAFGTGDFTVEFWINTTDTAGGLVAQAVTGGWATTIYASTIYWQSSYNATNLWTYSAASIIDGRWHHLAFSRVSGSTKFFIDGVLVATNGDTTNYAATTGNIQIGRDANPADLIAHISNLRIIKGTGLYTTTFTPSTTPLTAVSGTVLLTCQSNKFKDNSTNALTITPNGDVAVKSRNPFRQNSGKSIFFDNNGDYLKIPVTPILSQTNKYTVEFWFYPTYNYSGQYIFARNGGNYFCLKWTGTVMVVDKNGVGVQITGSNTLALNQWHHYAMTYDGTTTRVFANGVLDGSVSGTGGESTTVSTTIGYYEATGTSSYGGYIKDFRFTEGVALYTSAFTPPTTAFLTQ
jgi:hypothetical protein